MSYHRSRRGFLGSAGAGALAGLAGCVGSLTGSGSTTLRLLDWDYVYNGDAVAGFEERTGIKVDRQSAQSSAQNLSLLRAGRSDHDLIALGNYAVTPALEEGLIQPLELDAVPAYDDVFDFLKKDYFERDGQVFGVPRSFGQTPLAVNTELVDRDITSLGDLFNPELEGIVGGRDDARLEVLYERAAFDKEPLNPTSVDKVDFESTRSNLRNHVSLAGGLWSSGGDSEQLMRTEQVAVQPVWNYVTIALQNDGLPIEKVYPEEGTKAWFLQFCVREGAENVEAAHTFIQDWHENMGYDSLMAPFSIAIPNDRVFDVNDVDRTSYGLDDPDQFLYEDPKPQDLVRRYTETWTEAKNAAK
jgi:spermidine/putrescine transport system substrate-binding protein